MLSCDPRGRPRFRLRPAVLGCDLRRRAEGPRDVCPRAAVPDVSNGALLDVEELADLAGELGAGHVGSFEGAGRPAGEDDADRFGCEW
eukprot:3136835-Rhodomonas_salina.1